MVQQIGYLAGVYPSMSVFWATGFQDFLETILFQATCVLIWKWLNLPGARVGIINDEDRLKEFYPKAFAGGMMT